MNSLNFELVSESGLYTWILFIWTVLILNLIFLFLAGILGLYCHEGFDFGVCTRYQPKLIHFLSSSWCQALYILRQLKSKLRSCYNYTHYINCKKSVCDNWRHVILLLCAGVKINSLDMLDSRGYDRSRISSRAIEAYLIQVYDTFQIHPLDFKLLLTVNLSSDDCKMDCICSLTYVPIN